MAVGYGQDCSGGQQHQRGAQFLDLQILSSGALDLLVSMSVLFRIELVCSLTL